MSHEVKVAQVMTEEVVVAAGGFRSSGSGSLASSGTAAELDSPSAAVVVAAVAVPQSLRNLGKLALDDELLVLLAAAAVAEAWTDSAVSRALSTNFCNRGNRFLVSLEPF